MMPHTVQAEYRPDIDGLRSVAVIAVVAFHAFPRSVPGGFVGVDIFFVISGFLITGILLRQERISISDFYVRRIRRIFPALAVVLLACLLMGWAVLTPMELRSLGGTALAGSLSVLNIALYRTGGYFDAVSQTRPLLHLWSLGVEEQYYCAWPLFVAFLRSRRGFFSFTAALGAASFVACSLATHYTPNAAFYLPTYRLWELAAGSALAIWSRDHQPMKLQYLNGVAWCGLITLVLSVAVVREGDGFPGPWALLPVIGAVLLIAAGPKTLLGRALGFRPFVTIGLISYPLYLWHWPLLSFGHILLGDMFAPVIRLLALLVAVVMAAMTYYLIELRVRSLRTMWTHPGVLIASVLLSGALGGVFFVGEGLPSRMGSKPYTKRSMPTDRSTCPQTLQGGDDSALHYCRLSSNGSGVPVVALVGDSHADAVFDALSEADGRRWVMLGNPSCPPLLGVHVVGDQLGCAEKIDRILRFLTSREAAEIHTVFLSSYGGYMLDRSYAADHVVKRLGPSSISLDGYKTRAEKERVFEKGLEAYVVALRESNKRVVLIEDVPEFPFFPTACAARPQLGTRLRDQLQPVKCALERSEVEARQSSYLAMTRRLAERNGDLRVLHVLDHLCSSEVCSVIGPDDSLLYIDSHHLSAIGARRVAAGVFATLDKPGVFFR